MNSSPEPDLGHIAVTTPELYGTGESSQPVHNTVFNQECSFNRALAYKTVIQL
jgi:hypothetical protein